MKPLLSILVLSLCVFSQAVAQQSKATSLPTWISAKWAPDLPEYRQIRQQLEVLKFGPKRDLEKVRKLLAQHAAPLLRSLQSMGVAKRKVAVKDIFWAVALEAYFPNESARIKLNTAYILKSCPIEPTYEFARIAYCVYTQDASYDGPQIKLAERLLAKEPNDQLVQIHFVEMASFTSGYTKAIHDKSVIFAEELNRTLLYRPDISKPLLFDAYENHFLHSFSKASYSRFLTYANKYIVDVSEEDRGVIKRRLAYYKSIEKKIKWKDA